jgi:hypothetical protein
VGGELSLTIRKLRRDWMGFFPITQKRPPKSSTERRFSRAAAGFHPGIAVVAAVPAAALAGPNHQFTLMNANALAVASVDARSVSLFGGTRWHSMRAIEPWF